MSFKIPKEQLDICKKIREFKSNNKDREKTKIVGKDNILLIL